MFQVSGLLGVTPGEVNWCKKVDVLLIVSAQDAQFGDPCLEQLWHNMQRAETATCQSHKDTSWPAQVTHFWGFHVSLLLQLAMDDRKGPMAGKAMRTVTGGDRPGETPRRETRTGASLFATADRDVVDAVKVRRAAVGQRKGPK